jgi:hypothetical protein
MSYALATLELLKDLVPFFQDDISPILLPILNNLLDLAEAEIRKIEGTAPPAQTPAPPTAPTV